MLKKLAVLLVVIVIAVSANVDFGAVQAQSTTAMNMGEVRAVNAMVGIGPVDVYVDDHLIAFGLAPEEATPYQLFPAGKHILTFRTANADAASPPLATKLFDLWPNQSQTGIAYQVDSATSSSEQSGDVLFIEDDRSPLQLGKARVTAAHLAPDAPERLSIGYPSRAALLYQIRFQQPYGAIDIDAGLYSLAVVDADSPMLNIMKRAGDTSLYANTLYTMVIVPDIRPPGDGAVSPTAVTQSADVRLFIVSASVEPPQDGIRLRIVHAAHNTAVVDIYVDERLVAQRVNYGLGTEYLGLTKYSHTITLRNFGAAPNSPPLARANFIINADNQNQPTWTLMLLNAAGDTSIALPVGEANESTNAPAPTTFNTRGGPMMMTLLPDDVSQTRRGYSRIRLVHALDGFPELSLFALSAAVPSLASTPIPEPTAISPPALEFVRQTVFGSEAGETEVRSGFYSELDIRIALSSSSIASLRNLHLIDGLVYTFVVIGSNSGDPPLRVMTFADYGRGEQTNRLYSGTIRGTQVNIRQQPREGAPVVTILPRDWEVDTLARNFDGTWVRIRFNDPVTGSINEGWVFADLVLVTRLGTVINPRSLPEYTGIEQ